MTMPESVQKPAPHDHQHPLLNLFIQDQPLPRLLSAHHCRILHACIDKHIRPFLCSIREAKRI